MSEVAQVAQEQKKNKKGPSSEFLTLSLKSELIWASSVPWLQGLFHVTVDLAGFLGPREQTLSDILSEETSKVKRSSKSLDSPEPQTWSPYLTVGPFASLYFWISLAHREAPVQSVSGLNSLCEFL